MALFLASLFLFSAEHLFDFFLSDVKFFIGVLLSIWLISTFFNDCDRDCNEVIQSWCSKKLWNENYEILASLKWILHLWGFKKNHFSRFDSPIWLEMWCPNTELNCIKFSCELCKIEYEFMNTRTIWSEVYTVDRVEHYLQRSNT